ncbi:MAG: lysylphosphatidylglycerol synthase domain-containing protein [Chitinophagaceae bacterium]
MNKKLKILVNYFVAPWLFIWLSYSIYNAIIEQKDLATSWNTIVHNFNTSSKWRLIVACLLMVLNWGLEAKKWQLLMLAIQPLTYKRALRAVFSGQALALGTPNRIGEFAGRIVFLEEGNRLRGVSLSVVGSLAQIIVTFFMGVIGLIYIYIALAKQLSIFQDVSILWLKGLLSILSVFSILLLIFFYNLSWITKVFEKIKIVFKYKFFIEKLEDLHNKQLTQIIVLSFCRYVVYVLQYVLLFHFFEVTIHWWQICFLVFVQLLILAIIPGIALAELGIRGKVSIALFGMLTTNTIGIIATATSIWMINLIIPAVAGSLMILGLKIVRK